MLHVLPVTVAGLTGAGAYLAATPVATDPISILLNGGVIGLVVVLLITRKLVTKGELDNVAEQRDKAQAKADAMEAKITDQYIPAMIRNTTVLERLEANGRNGK